jgi:hypothetical protein
MATRSCAGQGHDDSRHGDAARAGLAAVFSVRHNTRRAVGAHPAAEEGKHLLHCLCPTIRSAPTMAMHEETMAMHKEATTMKYWMAILQVLKPQGGLPKDVMVNFLGDLTSHRLREEMARALIAEPGFMIGKVCLGHVTTHQRSSADQAMTAAVQGQVVS